MKHWNSPFFQLKMLHKNAQKTNRVINCYFILQAAKSYLLPVLRVDKIHCCNFSKGSTSFWNYLVVLKKNNDRAVFYTLQIALYHMKGFGILIIFIFNLSHSFAQNKILQKHVINDLFTNFQKSS